MKLRPFLPVFTASALLLSHAPLFASGNSGGDNGNINATVRNSNCTESGKSASSTVTESDGGTVEPTDGGSSLPTGNGVTRTTGGQGTDTYTPGKAMVLPLTPGKEYTVAWSGTAQGTASAHTLIEPRNLPEGYSVEVDDGSGWRKDDSVDHGAAQGQFLDLPALTTKFRIVRDVTPAGKGYPVQLTRPSFKYVPNHLGVTGYDGDSDGVPDLEIPRMHTMVSLGAATSGGRGVSSGHLVVDRELWVPAGGSFGVNTSMVTYEGISNPGEVTVVTTGANNRIRQVLAPQVILDVVATGGDSFEVRLYPPSAKGPANPDGTYTLSGAEMGKCQFERLGSSGSYPYGIRVRQYEGATLTKEAEFRARKLTGSGFETRRTEGAEVETVTSSALAFGGGTQNETVVIAGQGLLFGPNSYYRNETVELVRDGVTVSHSESRIPFTASGELVLDRKDKFGSGANDLLVTQFHYDYSNPSPGYVGKPLFRYNPDGSWEKYEYNVQGYPVKILRPWKGQPATPWTADDTNCRREDITYAPDPYNPVPVNAPAGVETALSGLVDSRKLHILGVLVQQTSYSYAAETVGGEPVLRKTTTEFSKAAETQTSVTRTYHGSASMAVRGKLIDETSPGGQKTSYVHEAGTWDGATKVFTVLASGLDTRETVTHGTTASPGGIANQTTRMVNIRNSGMKLLRQETQVYTGGSNYETATITDYSYDAAGRLISTVKDGRTVETRSYSGLATTITDETGVVRTITRDMNGRVTSDAKQSGPIATTVYNGTQSTTTIGTLSSTKAVDLLGRESSTTAVDGSVVTTSYPNNGKDKEVSYPGGLKVLFTRHPGGLEISTTNSGGTPVTPRHYTHGVNADGTRWTQTNFGTASSARWTKVTRDWLGRVISEESPAPSGTGTVIKTTEYNSAGLKSKETYSANAGLADRIYEYGSLGNLYRTGTDFNGGGLDETSADAITEYTFGYHKEGSEWYQQRLLKEYQTDNNASATAVETTRVRLNGNTAGNAGHVININAAGVTTEVTEVFDIPNKTRTLTTTRSDRSGSATQKWVNGLLVEERNSWDDAASVYGYDALERLETTTNPRNGSILTRAYNAQNQLASVTDHENNLTSYFYYPSTHANAGRTREIRDAKNKSVHYAYNDRGQNTRTWGAAAKPSEKAFDVYGQLSTLKTYRAGSGWTAATWPSGSEGTADTTTWRYFEATGLLKEKEDAATRKTAYTWKDNGRIHTRTWARGTVTTIGYDAAGLETSRVYSNEPAGINTPGVTITRDRNGRLKTVTDGAGTSTHTYTASHQLDTVTYGTSGILANYLLDYGFDAMGRQSGFTIRHNTTDLYQNTWGYEAVSGRLETIESGTHKAKYFRYKNSSLIQQITWENNGQPVMHNTRAYDSLSRLKATTHLIQNANGVQPVAHHGYGYDELHRRTKTTLLGGSYWSYVYNDRSELTGADKHLSSGTMLAGQQYHFGFDNAGNRTSKQTGGDTAGNNRRSFTTPSNNLNQYASLTTPGYLDVIGKAPAASTVTVNSATATRQGDYFRHELTAANTNGAWVSVSVADGGSPVTGHRYIPPASFTPSYDLDGNLTSDGEWDYTYDAENRLIKAQRTTAAQAAGAPYCRMEYAYDSAHRRIRAIHYHGSTSPPAKTEKYLHDNRNRCLTTDATDSPVQSFTWGLDALGSIDAAGGGAGGLLWITDHTSSETHLACTDGNANIVNLVSSTTKAVTATYEYTPFGELLRITGSYALANPYRFSSKPQDSETGNYDYGFRSYKPSWASWLGRDPLGEVGGNNLYGFIGSDPINDLDVNGLLSLWTHIKLFGETLTERDTYNQMGNNFKSIGRGIYNGAEGAVDGIANLPEIAKFAASEEAREMIDRLINDEEYRNEFAKRMGDSACDFLDKLMTNDGAFEASGELIFSLASGAAILKAIKVAKKLKDLLPRRKIKNSTDEIEGIPLSNNSARKLLRSRGASKQQAKEVVDSFEGQITATKGKAGDVLTVTETTPGSASGLFTTRGSAGKTAAERIRNLALPDSNKASVESKVTLTRDQTLLEGRVKSQVGNPGFGSNATGGGHQVVTDAFNGGIKRQ